MPHLQGRKEAQRGEVICPRAHSTRAEPARTFHPSKSRESSSHLFSITKSNTAWWGPAGAKAPPPPGPYLCAFSPRYPGTNCHALLALLSGAKNICESAETGSPDSRVIVTSPQSSGSLHRCQPTLWLLLPGSPPRLAPHNSCVCSKSSPHNLRTI